MRASLTDRHDRWRAALLAAALNLAIGIAIVRGLGVPVAPAAQEALKLFNLSDVPPPPPPIVPPPPEKAHRPTDKPKDAEGAAAPPAKRSTPSEIVAPKKTLPPPPPVQAARVAGQGTVTSAGAATIDGPGTGRGGVGNGLGSGLSGDGSGGGGAGRVAIDSEQVAGSIGDGDYPRDALVDRAQGVVHFAFTVIPDGHVVNCRITRSSGSRALDAATCNLATRRFRFRPARDAGGRPVASEEEGEQEWRLGREQEVVTPDPDR